MNELQIFNNEEFGQIRTIQLNNETYFIGKDVAEALGYAKARNAIATHVEEEDRKDAPIQGDLGGTQQMTIINESGLYALIFGSKLESAKRFKHWVTSEVLPSIRKTGRYQVPMSTAEQIQILAQGNVELEQKIDSVDKDLQEFKREMPLLAIECQQITEAKNKKVVPLLGGKDSNAYRNASLRGKVYRDLEGQLRREFGVSSYKAIHRNQTDKALEIISEYELPFCLAEQIADENSQINM